MKFHGKHKIIDKLTNSDKEFSLDIGAKEISHSKITLNIDRTVRPTIVADVRFLPFKSNIFETVYFLDVIEHLPINTELKALREINRILKYKGTLILSTPNHRWIYILLDPAFYILRHRHYREEQIVNFLNLSGFKVVKFFTMGGLWHMIRELYYSFLTFPFNLNEPNWMLSRKDKEYNQSKKGGWTIICKAKKSRELR